MILRDSAVRLCARLQRIFDAPAKKNPRLPHTSSQQRLLEALLKGGTLKSHRYLDGRKEFRLHRLGGSSTPVSRHDVFLLEKKGFLLSNHKFPAASLSLTQRGRQAAVDCALPGGQVPNESALTSS